MIQGVVNSTGEAVIGVSVDRSGGRRIDIEAIIDTGFNGWLTLPTELIASLGLSWHSADEAILADGIARPFNIYEATVVWDGQSRRILVYAADAQPLVGMAMLQGYELRIRVRDGGDVTIRRMG